MAFVNKLMVFEGSFSISFGAGSKISTKIRNTDITRFKWLLNEYCTRTQTCADIESCHY